MIVTVNEECEGGLVHVLALGKGGCLSHESSTSLSQCAVESLDMVGVGLGLILSQLLSLNDIGIRVPDISKAMSHFGIGLLCGDVVAHGWDRTGCS